MVSVFSDVCLHTKIYRETDTSNQQGGISLSGNLFIRYIKRPLNILQITNSYVDKRVEYEMPYRLWKKMQVYVKSSEIIADWYELNNTLIHSLTTSLPANIIPLVTEGFVFGLLSAHNGNPTTRFKDIFVRKRVFPEPELLYIDPVSSGFTANITSGFAPLIVGFTDQSLGNPTGWNWDFGDGATSTDQNPTHTYTVPDVYNVSLTVTKDDVPSDILVRTDYITVDATVAEFTADLFTGPADLLVQFTDMSVGDLTDWLWDFGDGNTSTDQNPAHLYTTAGVYDVTLTVNGVGGATDTITKSAYINCTLNAEFSANVTSGIIPLSVEFTDQSLGNPTEWEWDFGDGLTSTSQNPTHTYALPGLYTVTLRILNSTSENEIVKTDYITVEAPLIADFVGSPLSGNQPLAVQFHDLSVPEGIVTTWDWDFGDGSTHGTIKNPVHTYSEPGSYTISLTVSDGIGSELVVKPNYITVNVPVVEFSADLYIGPADLTVHFIDMSVGNITKWLWDFGDGYTSIEQNPVHIYTEAAVYDVTLTITSIGSNDVTSRTKFDYITCLLNPEFDINTTSGYAPLTVNFTDKSLGYPAGWDWDFGDGTSHSYEANPVHIYQHTGNFTVTLTITRDGVPPAVLIKSGFIIATMIGRFRGSPVKGYTPLIAYFKDRSFGSPPPNYWEWDFGDGTPKSYVKNPVHRYVNKGIYTVTLTINNSENARMTIIKTNYVNVVSLKDEIIEAIKLVANTYSNNDTKRHIGSNGTDWLRQGSSYKELETVIEGIANTILNRTIEIGNPFNSLVKTITDFLAANRLEFEDIFGIMVGDTFGITKSRHNNKGVKVASVSDDEFSFEVTSTHNVNTEVTVPLTTTIGPYKEDFNVEKTLWKIQASVSDNMPNEANRTKAGIVRKGLTVNLISDPVDSEVKINQLISALKTAKLIR